MLFCENAFINTIITIKYTKINNQYILINNHEKFELLFINFIRKKYCLLSYDTSQKIYNMIQHPGWFNIGFCGSTKGSSVCAMKSIIFIWNT